MNYSLDKQKELQIYDLAWLDSYMYLMVQNKSLNLPDTIRKIEGIITGLESSTSKGFLTSHDLQNFPVISEILPSFLTGNNLECEDYVNGEKSMESYK